jgi:hypothetical protein
MSTRPTVAETIAQQLGGVNRLSAMIGARHFLAGADSLTFSYKLDPKANKCRIILDRTTDTYCVEFLKVSPSASKPPVVVAEFGLVYADSLRTLFEKQTGLRLSI